MVRRAAEEPEGLAARGDPAADPVAVAREIALRQLTVRARSRSELEGALRGRGVPDEAINSVLDRFTEVRLVDDAAFAAQWVEAGQRRQRSRAGLRHELRGKGVDADTVREAVASVSDDDEYAAALALARKRAAGLSGVEPPVRLRRVLGALARRGFPPGVAHRAAREAVGGGDADAGDEVEGGEVEHWAGPETQG